MTNEELTKQSGYSFKHYCLKCEALCQYANENNQCSITACIKVDWSEDND